MPLEAFCKYHGEPTDVSSSACSCFLNSPVPGSCRNLRLTVASPSPVSLPAPCCMNTMQNSRARTPLVCLRCLGLCPLVATKDSAGPQHFQAGGGRKASHSLTSSCCPDSGDQVLPFHCTLSASLLQSALSIYKGKLPKFIHVLITVSEINYLSPQKHSLWLFTHFLFWFWMLSGSWKGKRGLTQHLCRRCLCSQITVHFTCQLGLPCKVAQT